MPLSNLSVAERRYCVGQAELVGKWAEIQFPPNVATGGAAR
jgi:hypothetical protein